MGLHLKTMLKNKFFVSLVEAATEMLKDDKYFGEDEVVAAAELEIFREKVDTWWDYIYRAVALPEYHGNETIPVLPSFFHRNAYGDVKNDDGTYRTRDDDLMIRPEYYVAGVYPALGKGVGACTLDYANGALLECHSRHQNSKSNGLMDATGKRIHQAVQTLPPKTFDGVRDPRTRLPYVPVPPTLRRRREDGDETT